MFLKFITGAALSLCAALPALAESAFTSADFTERRNTVSQKMGPNDLLIVFAADELKSSHDVHYVTRPDVSLRYLTGITQTETVLMMRNTNGTPSSRIYAKPADLMFEKWEGRIATFDALAKTSGVRNVQAHTGFESYVMSALRSLPDDAALWLVLDVYPIGLKMEDMALHRAHRFARRVQAAYPHIKIKNLLNTLHTMRRIKSENEIEAMRKVVQISARGHIAAMKRAKDATHEYQIEAAFENSIRSEGATGLGYPTIAGAGENATILHYVVNDMPLNGGEMFVVDAAAELEGYMADITRSFPAGGKFSDAQKDIYNLVLKAQEAAFAVTKAGTPYADIVAAANKVIQEGLFELGLITEPSFEQMRLYYYHGLGHGLGIDVHDPMDRTLMPAGTVFTIEPGVYVNDRFVRQEATFKALPEADQNKILKALEKYNHIGVRIEDDILVTADGYENLSHGLPRTVEEVEALITGK